MLVIVEHFNKYIEVVALSKNSSKLEAMAFLDCILAHFRALFEVLKNQEI